MTAKKKAIVQIGYTKDNLDNYKYWSRLNLAGADITAIDGLGNRIQLNIREGDVGFRLEINGETIRDVAAVERANKEREQ